MTIPQDRERLEPCTGEWSDPGRCSELVPDSPGLWCLACRYEALLASDRGLPDAWPEGLEAGKHYRVLCDDKGRNGGSWLQVFVSEADGDAYVSMQDWEDIPEGEPSAFPSIRVRTWTGGGRSHRTRMAILRLANAIRLDQEEFGTPESED